jgi:DnaJ domain
MSAWRGKAIGFLLGLLTRRPPLIVLGVLIGHLFDMGLFTARPPAARPSAPDALAAAYATLGVSRDADDAELEQAYRRLISDYHPDRVANAAQELRDLAGVRAREINAAIDTIRRARQRDA